jgi:zinc transporter 2
MIIGKRKANSSYTFGFYRSEVIGALISVITIWILTVILIQEAYERFKNPKTIDSKIMLITAIIGLICNLSMMSVLHSSGISHGAGCSHGHVHQNSSQSDNHTKLTVNSESGDHSNNSSGDGMLDISK